MTTQPTGKKVPVTTVTTPNGITIGGNYYDEIEFVGEVEKGKGFITVIRGRKGQNWTVKIQEWWQQAATGQWIPAKNGMSMPYDDQSLKDIIVRAFDEG